MKILNYFGSLLSGVLSSDAQSSEILLPSPVPDSEPTASRRDLLINTGGVFLAGESKLVGRLVHLPAESDGYCVGHHIPVGCFMHNGHEHSHHHHQRA